MNKIDKPEYIKNREKFLRLKMLAQGMLMCANAALAANATKDDVDYALLLCKDLNID